MRRNTFQQKLNCLFVYFLLEKILEVNEAFFGFVEQSRADALTIIIIIIIIKRIYLKCPNDNSGQKL